MPRAIAIASMGVGLFIVGKAVLRGERGVGLGLEGWARDAGALARGATVLALIVLYIVVSPVLGFTPTALLVMTAAMLVLGRRPVPALLISAISTLAIQQSFGRLLLVPLPLHALAEAPRLGTVQSAVRSIERTVDRSRVERDQSTESLTLPFASSP